MSMGTASLRPLPRGLPSPRRWSGLGGGQVHRSSPFSDIHEISNANAEHLRQFVQRAKRRVPAAALQLLVVAVGDPGGGQLLLGHAGEPASLLQVLAESTQEDSEIHAPMMAGPASLIEPTQVACFGLMILEAWS
jgi:hypothetical protein